MAKQTITNISAGPRVANGVEGPVTIPAGGSAEVDMSDAELKVAKSTKWFEFGKSAAKEAAKADDGEK